MRTKKLDRGVFYYKKGFRNNLRFMELKTMLSYRLP